MADTPRVSVILPARDPDPEYFPIAVKSVLSQTERDVELLVVEDPHGRRAADVLAPFAGDARLRIVTNPKRDKLGAALNYALSQARAELVARMDADDECLPSRLARQLAFMDAHPEVDLCGTQIEIIDPAGRRLGYRSFPLEHAAIARTLTRYNCISHPSVVFRRDAVRSLGGYRAGIPNEDYDLWCRMVRAGQRLANLPEVLVRYRFHPDALKFTDMRDILRVTVDIKREHFAGELDLVARARIAAERALLRLPAPVTLRLFRLVQYSRRPAPWVHHP